MMKETTNRTRIVGLRLTPKEFVIIEKQWKKSTCRKLSEYIRHCLFNKPITSTYRNASLDDMIEEISQLKGELNHIGNNYNQAVKKLHTLHRLEDFKQWIEKNEKDKLILFDRIKAIDKHFQKIAESWLQ